MVRSFRTYLIVFIFSLLEVQVAHAQQLYVDSLKMELAQATSDSLRLRLLNDISFDYAFANPDSGIYYGFVARKLSEQLNNTREKAQSYNSLGVNYFMLGKLDTALQSFQQASDLFKEVAYYEGYGNAQNNVAIVYKTQGNYELAKRTHEATLEMRKELRDTTGMADSYGNLAIIYRSQGNYPKALEYHQKSLELKRFAGNERGMAISYDNIGLVHFYQKNYKKSLEKHRQALKIRQKIGDERGQSISLDHIGNVYAETGDYEAAQKAYEQSLELVRKNKDQEGIASSLGSVGNMLLRQGKYKEAKSYQQESLGMARQLGIQTIEIGSLNALAKIALEEKKHAEAIQYASTALQLAEGMDEKEGVRSAAATLNLAYLALEQYKKAHQYLDLYHRTTDSLFSQERTREITLLESEFAFKEEKDSIQFAQRQERLQFERETELRETRQRLTYIGLGLTFLLLLLSVVFFVDKQRNNRKLALANQRLAETNEELQVANEEIKTTQEETMSLNESLQQTLNLVQKQKQDITDSINYAQRIQAAILPSSRRVEQAFPEHFIFFRPRDVVSGDFYWLSDLQDQAEKVVFAAVDCTGHGVPGAFMSMVGNDLLNHIVNERHITEAGAILTQLHLDIRKALNQEETNNRDGMDISLIVWDKKQKQLQFAGAKNPLVYVQNNQLKRIKGDKMPIGGQQRERQRIFTTQNIDLSASPTTTCYLFSDGFQDQFGGNKGRKYMSKRFRELLFDIHTLPMSEQQRCLSDEFVDWRGKEEQLDDVLVVGLKLL